MKLMRNPPGLLRVMLMTLLYVESTRGVFPIKRLVGMYRWMGIHFRNWIDDNEVAFSIEQLE